jgi:hypothetical protein
MTLLEWGELIGATVLYFLGHYHGKSSGIANQGIALAKQVVSSLPPTPEQAAAEAAGKAEYKASESAGPRI